MTSDLEFITSDTEEPAQLNGVFGADPHKVDGLRNLMEIERERAMEEAESAEEARKAEEATGHHPLIPSHLYPLLPRHLQDISASMEDDRERDVFLTMALAIIAGALENVVGDHGDGQDPLSLYAAVAAEAGSGKGIGGMSRRLGALIDKRLYEKSEAARAEWRARKAAGEKFDDPEPSCRTFYISGNSSARALVNSLRVNKGRGVLQETETLTVTLSQSQDWGDTSDVMLKAYHGEPVTLDRKEEKIRIDSPALSIALTGTPSALRALIPSAENGLLSRFCLYSFEAPPVWKSPRPGKGRTERDNRIAACAEALNAMHTALSERSDALMVQLTTDQWDRLDDHFGAELQRHYETGGSRILEASIKRSGLIAFRIACVLAVFRAFECGHHITTARSVEATDQDAAAGLILATVYLHHALAFAATLPSRTLPKMKTDKAQWLEALPEMFETAEAEFEGQKRGVAARTVRDWLQKLVGSVLEHDAHGQYRKRKSALSAVSALPAVSVPAIEPEKADTAQKADTATGHVRRGTI